ncbi:MAG: hypothetical protein ACM3IJ_02925 [Candidatus Levyibacteriota bacterium]
MEIAEIPPLKPDPLYKEHQPIPLKGRIITSIHGHEITQDTSLPFRGFTENDPDHPVFSVAAHDPAATSGMVLEQVSRHHGRALEVKYGEKPIALWSDNEGFIYGSLNLKGNNFTDPHVEKDKHFQSGFKTIGLQEGIVIWDTIKASEAMRKAGVETEKTEAVVLLEEGIQNGEAVPMDKFKKGLLTRALSDSQRKDMSPFGERSLPELSDIARLQTYVSQAEFYITQRALQVPERLRDLKEVKTKEGFEKLMRRVFAFVNAREKIEAKREGREPQVFNALNPEDINSYFGTFLPQRMAKNIGRMHVAGLTHHFLTDHNVSLAGSIYDLDSMTGEALGDKGIPTPKEDLNELIGNLIDVYGLSGNKVKSGSYFSNVIGPDVADQFFDAFIPSYLDTVWSTFDIQEEKTRLTEEIRQGVPEIMKEFPGKSKDEVRKILHEEDADLVMNEIKECVRLDIALWISKFFDNKSIVENQLRNMAQIKAQSTIAMLGEEYFQNLREKFINLDDSPVEDSTDS